MDPGVRVQPTRQQQQPERRFPTAHTPPFCCEVINYVWGGGLGGRYVLLCADISYIAGSEKGHSLAPDKSLSPAAL